MALDALTRKIIGALSAGFPALGETVFDAAEAREILSRAPASPLPPTQVGRVEDRTADGVPVRIYWPPDSPDDMPLVLFLHGGGFVVCDLDSHDGFARDLCAGTGAVVVSVGYRLAPEHPFPAAVEDAYTALTWTHAQAAALGADPHRLAVAGDSAGGNLAAVLTLLARDRGGPSLRHQLLIYPVTDAARDTPSYTRHADDGFLTATAMAWFWAQYLADPSEGAHPHASPLRAPDLSGLPPACVITAEHDPLRDEGEAYAARLAAAGVPVSCHRITGSFHGFISLPQILPAARTAQELAFQSVRTALAH